MFIYFFSYLMKLIVQELRALLPINTVTLGHSLYISEVAVATDTLSPKHHPWRLEPFEKLSLALNTHSRSLLV